MQGFIQNLEDRIRWKSGTKQKHNMLPSAPIACFQKAMLLLLEDPSVALPTPAILNKME
jgi:hypothetical protein